MVLFYLFVPFYIFALVERLDLRFYPFLFYDLSSKQGLVLSEIETRGKYGHGKYSGAGRKRGYPKRKFRV